MIKLIIGAVFFFVLGFIWGFGVGVRTRIKSYKRILDRKILSLKEPAQKPVASVRVGNARGIITQDSFGRSYLAKFDA